MAKGEATTKPSKAPARLSERSKAKSEGASLPTTVEIVPSEPDILNLRQRLFVEAYIGRARGNATESARVAGYEGDDNALSQAGFRLVRDSNVSAEIAKRRKELVASVSAEALILGAQEDAMATVEDFVTINEDGSFKFDLAKAKAAGKLHLIEDLAHDKETGAPIVKLPNRRAAREFIAKMLGFGKGEQPSSQTNTQINIYENLNKLSTEDLRKIREAKQLTEGGKD